LLIFRSAKGAQWIGVGSCLADRISRQRDGKSRGKLYWSGKKLEDRVFEDMTQAETNETRTT